MSADPTPVGDFLGATVERIRSRQRSDGDEPTPAEIEAAAREADPMAFYRATRWEAAIPSRFLWATLCDFVVPVANRLRSWAETTPPTNLVTLGPVGVGKTHAAVGACRLAHDSGLEVSFEPVEELMDRLRSTYDGGGDISVEMRRLFDVDRLILDDVGREKASEWTAVRIGVIINRRWLEQRPTIVTSNLDPKALERHLDEHVYSRLVGSGAVSVHLSGTDRRRSRPPNA